MTASTFKFINPVAYYVNSVEKIDVDVRTAFLSADTKKIRELSQENRCYFDTFIWVNSSWHAFLLMIPSKEQSAIFPGYYSDDQLNDVAKVEELLFVWICELRYDNMELRTYVIDFRMVIFSTIEKAIALKEGQSVTLNAVGRQKEKNGEWVEVSRFEFTWSFKAKN